MQKGIKGVILIGISATIVELKLAACNFLGIISFSLMVIGIIFLIQGDEKLKGGKKNGKE